MRFSIVFFSADEADEYIKNSIAYQTIYETIAYNEINGDNDEEDKLDLLNSLALKDSNFKIYIPSLFSMIVQIGDY
jgi:hypothetical protein